MYSLYANDDDILYGIQKYIVDTEEDMRTLPNHTRAGSTAFVIETSATYILNHSKEWKEIKNNTELDNITVDQTYNPESENAQSGKAVAEAIALANESETEEILSIVEPIQVYEKGHIYYISSNNKFFINTSNFFDTYVYQVYAGKKYRFFASFLSGVYGANVIYATGSTLYVKPESGFNTGVTPIDSFSTDEEGLQEYEIIPDEDCYLYRQIIRQEHATVTVETDVYEVTEVATKEEKEKGIPSFKVAEDGNSIEISYPYGNEVLSVVLGKGGGNNLFDFRKISTPSTTIFNTNLSDWHSPFVVSVVNNANGDTPDAQYFTGGNHRTSNSGTGGAVTARMAELKFFANGKLLSNGASGNARHIEMKWTNFVQAYNTTKADGSGREVLQENHSLAFVNGKFNANVEIIPLEDITINTYYGLQGITNHYKKIRYIGGTNRGLYEGASESGDLTTYRIECSSENHKMCIEIDPIFDLGKRSNTFVNGTKGIFSTDYGKCYFSIINKPVNMNSGYAYYLRGSWEFKPNF